MAATLQQFLARAATLQHVVMLGGLAIIAHGYSRPTKDGDAWLEPLASPEEWAERLRETLRAFDGLALWSLAERRPLGEAEIAEAIGLDGVLRVRGLTADLDLFRKANICAAPARLRRVKRHAFPPAPLCQPVAAAARLRRPAAVRPAQ
jgi:hypothetical protein